MDAFDPMAGMTPEQRRALIAQMLELGSAETDSDIAQQEIDRALGASNPSAEGYGAWGGAMNGLNNAVSQITSAIQAKGAMGRRDNAMKRVGENRSAMLAVLGEGLDDPETGDAFAGVSPGVPMAMDAVAAPAMPEPAPPMAAGAASPALSILGGAVRGSALGGMPRRPMARPTPQPRQFDRSHMQRALADLQGVNNAAAAGADPESARRLRMASEFAGWKARGY